MYFRIELPLFQANSKVKQSNNSSDKEQDAKKNVTIDT